MATPPDSTVAGGAVRDTCRHRQRVKKTPCHGGCQGRKRLGLVRGHVALSVSADRGDGSSRGWTRGWAVGRNRWLLAPPGVRKREGGSAGRLPYLPPSHGESSSRRRREFREFRDVERVEGFARGEGQRHVKAPSSPRAGASLNEGPLQKERQYGNRPSPSRGLGAASMKGPSRRRGNGGRGNRAPTRHYTGRLRAVLKKDGSRVED